MLIRKTLQRVFPCCVFRRYENGIHSLVNHEHQGGIVDQVHERVLLGIVPVHVDTVLRYRLVGMVLPSPVTREGPGARHVDGRPFPVRFERLGHHGLRNDYLVNPLVQCIEIRLKRAQPLSPSPPRPDDDTGAAVIRVTPNHGSSVSRDGGVQLSDRKECGLPARRIR
ncbi:hypothetical protein DSECCO2_622060 [anaerobic digester metagenome]